MNPLSQHLLSLNPNSIPSYERPSPPSIHVFEEPSRDQVALVVKSLNEEVLHIKNQKGSIKDLMKGLLGFLESRATDKEVKKNESDARLNELNKRYELCEEALRVYHEKDLAFLQKDLLAFNKDLRKNLGEYLDLTYGFGKFDEHDGYSKQELEQLALNLFSQTEKSGLELLHKKVTALINLYGEADYTKRKTLCKEIRFIEKGLEVVGFCSEILQDQENCVRMLERLARKAIIESFHELDEEDFIESFNDCLRKFSMLLSKLSEAVKNTRNTEKLLEVLEDLENCFQEILSFITSAQEALDNEISNEEPERYDDPHDKSKIFALTQGFERLDELCAFVNKFLEQLELFKERIEHYAQEFEEEKSLRVDFEETGRQLIDEFKKLNKKPNQIDSSSLLLHHKDEQLRSYLDPITRLIYQKELIVEYPAVDYYRLKIKIKDLWKKLETEIKRVANLEDLIGIYVEIKRAEEKYTSLWACKVSVAEELIEQVGEISIEKFSETAFAFVSNKRPFYQAQALNPLDSPLVRIVYELSNSGEGVGKWKNFLLLADRPFTFFERGMFKVVVGKDIDKVTTDRQVYSEVVKRKHPLKSKEELMAGSPYPQYYTAFDVSSLNAVFTNEEWNAASSSVINLYSLLTVHLAYSFSTEQARRAKAIPSGHSIAALLVSKTGQILSWAVNTIGEKEEKDPIRHAEINTIMSYFLFTGEKSIPEGAFLFSSLKPCHMCAGGIYEAGFNSLGRVFYALNDPGQGETVINTMQEKVDLKSFVKIDNKYLELKKETPCLNAAGSLGQIREFAETIRTELCSFETSYPKYFYHVKNFWKIAVGRDLMAS